MPTAINELTVNRLLLNSFALTILVGTGLLALPVSVKEGVAALSLLDALFTTTSAVCVTGLTVVDTGSTFSLFGQGVLVGLIQVGGLGFLTLSTFFLTQFFQRPGRMSPQNRLLLETSHGSLAAVTPGRLLVTILLFTLVVEALGACFLLLRFADQFPMGQAVWLAVFHAISAFCNAGFGLFGDNLMAYQSDWLVNLVVMGLIILGGIGFLVVADGGVWLKGRWQGKMVRLSLHSRLVLMTSLILILAGGVLIALLEWNGPALGQDVVGNVLGSLFLSVTSRTAGFNTVDISQLTGATLFIVILLMAIGGSPGSTAGGMKTTTAAVCFALLLSRGRNRPKVEVLQRSIPAETVTKAMFIVTGYVLAIILGVVMLQMTEAAHLPYNQSGGNLFLGHLFEVVSALGTVGLSAGVTPTLTAAGKLIIIVLMFVGRVGPLMIANAVVGGIAKINYSYAEENVNIG